MQEICKEVGEYCDASIVNSFTQYKKFNHIEQEKVREIFKENISVEMK